MFSIKTVTTFPTTKQIKESVIEVEEYDILKTGHGTIEVTFPNKKFSIIMLSQVQNRRDGIASKSVFIANANGKTIDKLHPTDTFDTSMNSDEWDIENKKLTTKENKALGI